MPVLALAATLGVSVVAAVAAGGTSLRGHAAAQIAGSSSRTFAASFAQPRVDVEPAATVASQDTISVPPQPATTAAPAAADATAVTTAAPAQASSSSSPETVAPAAVNAAAPAPTAPVSTTPPLTVTGSSSPVQGSSALSAAPAPLEREHKVAQGETLSAIAQRYGLATETLVINNAGVTDRDMLKVGQTLRVPPRDGLLYEVRLGESVQAISARFGVEPATIVKEPANNLTSPDVVRQGQVLLVPGAHAVQAAATAIPTAAAALIATVAPPLTAATLPTTAALAPAASVAPARGGWQWPITGPLSSYFGPAHPLGIDVDLYGRAGAPVGAARAGVVSFAGGNPCCSYGYYVEVDHGDGFRTIYAHFQSPPVVRIGQRVAQGQVLGYAGTTGYSTGVHLHFEVRRAGVPVNPLAYLP